MLLFSVIIYSFSDYCCFDWKLSNIKQVLSNRMHWPFENPYFVRLFELHSVWLDRYLDYSIVQIPKADQYTYGNCDCMWLLYGVFWVSCKLDNCL